MRITSPLLPGASRTLIGLAAFALISCSPELPVGPEAGALSPASRAFQAPSTIVANVYFKDQQDLDRLAVELDLLEHVDHQQGFAVALLDQQQYADLLEQGYRVEVDQLQTELMNQPFVPVEGQLSGIPSYPCYRTVEETYNSLSSLAASKPGLASWIDIGDSWDKVTAGGGAGYDLGVLVLTNKAIAGPKPRFFLMGAIHAREYTTAELATRFAEELANGYGTDPDATWLLDNFELHVLPHTNPDGRKLAEQGYSQRKNINNTNGGTCSNPPTSSSQYGTDLNRNSSFKWGGAGTSTSPCNLSYRGQSAAAEPEVRAVESYMDSLFPDQRGSLDTDPAPATTTGVMISLHSYSPNVLFPWGYTTTKAPNATQLQTLGRKFGYFNGYGVCQPSSCLYAASGTTDDQAYGKLGIAAFTFELGTSFFQSCTTFEGTIVPNNKPALRYAFKAARQPYLSSLGPDTLGVQVSASTVTAGASVTLSATADDTRYNSNGYGTEPVQNIAAARYTVDAPSWGSGVTPVAMTASDGAFSATQEGVRATVNTTGWAVGRHILFVESQDALGNWGVPSAVFLTVQ
jgi:carboxypeptidase T